MHALRYAVRLAKPFDAAFHLVYVVERPSFVHDIKNVPLILPEKKLAKIARKKLAGIANAEIGEILPTQIHVSVGKPFSEIVTLARQSDADLIVIATRGRTGLPRILLGSTEQVVRHAPCAVLVVREHARSFNS